MRLHIKWLMIVLAIFSLVLMENHQSAIAESTTQQDVGIGYVEDITFEKMVGKERIAISVSKQPVLKIESPKANSVIMTLENMVLANDLKRPLGEGLMKNIIKVLPYENTTNGNQAVVLETETKQRAPYSVKQENRSIFLDFNISAASPVGEESPITSAMNRPEKKEPDTASPSDNAPAVDQERKITIDFQNADIKSVLRLLAETGNVNIVSGDDVKGAVTVSMKRIPWSQALDTVLAIKSLTKKQEGNVITVMTLSRFKKDEADRKAAEDEFKKTQQAELIEKGKLRQVSIEAKIVEASEDFVRNLGVHWGVANASSIGSTPYGVVAGTNPEVGATTTLPNDIGLTASNLAINFPSTITAGTPGIGFIVGGTKAVLDAQLSALETNNQGQIISSPKVTTMDNVKATIKQGEEIPYTTVDNEGNPTVSFKDALLKLEVTPKITEDNKISMTILASNDRGNYARVTELQGNVPIVKNEVNSTVVVRDGDTIVIGGVLKTEDTKGTSGVPWLSKIPILGWLFKTESITKTKRHLLIFVTPKIIQDNRV
ncbi:MAG: secretin and TonB N-terminal domain-containing protein [Deltaproteobacteria bacterium]|nr:secretin and TonB N-terminal domain-containing protein [Deltaproteobacteria bacterium]